MNSGVGTMTQATASSNLFRRLVEEEQRWLARQEQSVQKRLLDVYSQTFSSLQEELERLPADSYSRRQVSAIERQLAVLLQDSARQQSRVLGDGLQRIYAGRLPAESQAWARLEALMGEPDVAQQFRAFLPVVNQRSVKALLLTQDISIKRFSDDLTTRVRANVAGSMLRGDGIQKTVQRLKEVRDLQGHEPRLKLIARMETARANNQAKSDFIEQVNEEFPELELWQRVRDRVDKSKKTRNHWFSWAVNNTVRNVSQEDYFEVHHAEIARARQEYAAITGKKTYDSGILFERFTEGRRGKSIPAHFHDRAVLLGWRPEWGNGFADVKYPQGGKEPAQTPDEEKPSPAKSKPETHAAVLPWDTDTPAGRWHWAAFDDAPDDIKRAVQRQPPPPVLQSTERGPRAYAMKNKHIEMAAYEPYTPLGQAVWRHEFGHWVDFNLPSKNKYLWSADDTFTRAMKLDESALMTQTGKLKPDSVVERLMIAPNKDKWLAEQAAKAGIEYDALTNWIEKTPIAEISGIGRKQRIAEVIEAMRLKDAQGFLDAIELVTRGDDGSVLDEGRKKAWELGFANISDLFDAATLKRITGSGGHSLVYYKGFGARQTECFANIFDLISDDFGRKIAETFVPNMLKSMQEALNL